MDTPASIGSPSEVSSPTPILTPNFQELTDLQADKRLQRLKFLVERSKIYATILSERLAIPSVTSEKSTSDTPLTPITTPIGGTPSKDASPNEAAISPIIPLVTKSVPIEVTSAIPTKRRGRQSKAAVAAESAAKSAAAKSTQKSILDFVKKENNKSTEEEKTTTRRQSRRALNNISTRSEEEDELPETHNSTAPLEPSKVETGQPALLTGGTLHPYQLAGVEWMVSLFENGLNGVLADEMGLGKTVQVIAFIAYLIEHSISGPFLIVAPLSTIENWTKEFARFTPDISVVKYHGTPEERAKIRNERMTDNTRSEIIKGKRHKSRGSNSPSPFVFPVIVTSYEIIINDAKYLGQFTWKYIIVDEGHRLKNMNCRLIKQLKKFDSANRMLLTGTPLQNNLAELWSLLNFLLPDIFSDLELFQAWFENSGSESPDLGDASVNDELITSLHAILRPFLLRRLKTDIEMFLPDKREYVIYGGLTDDQTELYENILQRTAREYVIDKIIEARGGTKRQTIELSDEEGVDETLLEEGELIEKFDSNDLRRPPRQRKRKRRIGYSELSDDDDVDDESFIRSLSNKAKRGTGNRRKSRLSRKTREQDENDYGNDDDDNEADNKDDNDITSKMVKQANRETRGKSFQNIVMQLRLACNSPFLFYYPWTAEDTIDDRLIKTSGKMILADKLVTRLVKDGHKVLIFSQFTKMLDVLEDWAYELKKWKYCRIDGSTSQESRQEQIDIFNSNPNYKIFLLSTRSGGLGINLTSADSVILFDSDWNPQQDLQAMDRVHRIGQTRPVIVYRLATANTVEQQLLDRAGAKRKLEQVVIESGKFKGFGFQGGNQDEAIELMKKALVKNEPVTTMSNGINDNDFEILMDRSPESYQRARDGTEGLADNISTLISMSKPRQSSNI